jgi:hypothetical protein
MRNVLRKSAIFSGFMWSHKAVKKWNEGMTIRAVQNERVLGIPSPEPLGQSNPQS